MQIFILGMHRSGTSVVTRVLNLMGCYFAPEGTSTGANDENPKGFWERRDVRNVNDALLHSLGCEWDRIADLNLDLLSKDSLNNFDKAVKSILLELDGSFPLNSRKPSTIRAIRFHEIRAIVVLALERSATLYLVAYAQTRNLPLIRSIAAHGPSRCDTLTAL